MGFLQRAAEQHFQLRTSEIHAKARAAGAPLPSNDQHVWTLWVNFKITDKTAPPPPLAAQVKRRRQGAVHVMEQTFVIDHQDFFATYPLTTVSIPAVDDRYAFVRFGDGFSVLVDPGKRNSALKFTLIVERIQSLMGSAATEGLGLPLDDEEPDPSQDPRTLQHIRHQRWLWDLFDQADEILPHHRDRLIVATSARLFPMTINDPETGTPHECEPRTRETLMRHDGTEWFVYVTGKYVILRPPGTARSSGEIVDLGDMMRFEVASAGYFPMPSGESPNLGVLALPRNPIGVALTDPAGIEELPKAIEIAKRDHPNEWWPD